MIVFLFILNIYLTRYIPRLLSGVVLLTKYVSYAKLLYNNVKDLKILI